MTIKYAQFGSVSSGTMVSDDLLSAFARELNYQMKRQSTRFKRRELKQLVRDANAAIGSENEYSKSDIVSELFDALEQFAPPYGYFGANPNDGADYGYWTSDSLDQDFDGLKVCDLTEVPRGYRGEILIVSDHGNLTFGVIDSRGKFRDIWSVV